jgi:hypothetical protein
MSHALNFIGKVFFWVQKRAQVHLDKIFNQADIVYAQPFNLDFGVVFYNLSLLCQKRKIACEELKCVFYKNNK